MLTSFALSQQTSIPTKENTGEVGSNHFILYYTTVTETEALKPGLDMAKHFVQRSKDGKKANAVNINYTYIQAFNNSFAAT